MRHQARLERLEGAAGVHREDLAAIMDARLASDEPLHEPTEASIAQLQAEGHHLVAEMDRRRLRDRAVQTRGGGR